MKEPPKVSVLVPAAGRGARMGRETPKQYLMLGNFPVIVHTLRTIESVSSVGEILLMGPAGDQSSCLSSIVETYGLAKVSKVVTGGPTRQASVWNGLQALAPDTDIVVVHDGVRPLVTRSMIDACIQEALQADGAIACVKIHDTTKLVSRAGVVQKTTTRDGLWAAQTPQAFKYHVLVDAHRKALADHFHATDDASLVERLGYRVHVVAGSWMNLKVTAPHDLVLAECLLHWRETGRLTL